jgi:signal transduction histidine kinase/ActR/RegA family two-component response regulator
MQSGGYARATQPYIVAAVLACSLLALLALLRRPQRTLIDLWLMVVMCIWICEVALAALFNGGRFDLGFYAGRIYSLLAASFVLIALLSQYAGLASQAAEAAAALATAQERRQIAEEREQLLLHAQAARGEAEVANRTKDEFLAMLGHELRNPLAPIRTALQLMRMRDKTAVAKEREIIERQVDHLIRLVDDLLDVSRITKGMISIEKMFVDMSSVISSAVEMSSPLITQRGHHFELKAAPDLCVVGDAARLAQAISNLLINAAKFTPSGGGQIALHAFRDSKDVVISVRDNGLGMTASAAATIFEPFVQLGHRETDRPLGGLGLGLAIVRSLVHLHGGIVEARSDGPGLGAEFTVRLPAADSPQASFRSQSASEESSSLAPGRKILVVDDNVDAADSLADLLSSAGHMVQVAYDGRKALEVATSFVPDVAFLDIGLPVMDGFELARRLRQLWGFDKVTIVAVTGYGLDQHRHQAVESGFDEHLVKPVSAEQVFDVIAGGTGQAC